MQPRGQCNAGTRIPSQGPSPRNRVIGLGKLLFPTRKVSFQYWSWKDLGRAGSRESGKMKMWGPSQGQESQCPLYTDLLLPSLLQLGSSTTPPWYFWGIGKETLWNHPLKELPLCQPKIQQVHLAQTLPDPNSMQGRKKDCWSRVLWSPSVNLKCTPGRGWQWWRARAGRFQDSHRRALNPSTEHETQAGLFWTRDPVRQ